MHEIGKYLFGRGRWEALWNLDLERNPRDRFGGNRELNGVLPKWQNRKAPGIVVVREID